MTILDANQLTIASINFSDNTYHGEHYADEGELCPMALKGGTTTCHRHCTLSVVSNQKPVMVAMTYVRSDGDGADAINRVLAPIEK